MMFGWSSWTVCFGLDATPNLRRVLAPLYITSRHGQRSPAHGGRFLFACILVGVAACLGCFPVSIVRVRLVHCSRVFSRKKKSEYTETPRKPACKTEGKQESQLEKDK